MTLEEAVKVMESLKELTADVKHSTGDQVGILLMSAKKKHYELCVGKLRS